MIDMSVLVLPSLAILGGFLIAIVAMILKSKDEGRKHKERMLLAEKGLPVPRELYEEKQAARPKANGYRAGRAWLMILGCMLVFIGLGVIVFSAASGDEAARGLVPLFIGIGFLVSERMLAKVIARPDKD